MISLDFFVVVVFYINGSNCPKGGDSPPVLLKGQDNPGVLCLIWGSIS